MSLFILLDAVHGVQSGNVRALGRQSIVSVATLVLYYGVGIPSALFFGFELELGLSGFWYGYVIAMCFLDLIVIYLVFSSSWQAEFKAEPKSEKAKERRLT